MVVTAPRGQGRYARDFNHDGNALISIATWGWKDDYDELKNVIMGIYVWCNFLLRSRHGETLRKLGGEIDGQPFDLTALNACEVTLLDHSEAVQVDDLADCR